MTRYVRFSLNPSAPPTAPDHVPGVKYGIVEDGTVHETEPMWGSRRGGISHALAEVRLLPPACPTKIVCVGRNYVEHAKELGNPLPEEPLIFLKPVSSLAAPGDAIIYPAISQCLHYEGELGVVIGRRARNVAAEEAADCIFGYTCINDVTARDLQKKDGQWTRGKGFDTFCPVGPWAVPKDEIALEQLRLCTRVNGQVRQNAPVTDMIFSVDDIIAFVTRFMTLEPGDLIATGTPPGVGSLEVGSRVEIEIEGIGILQNSVVRE